MKKDNAKYNNFLVISCIFICSMTLVAFLIYGINGIYGLSDLLNDYVVFSYLESIAIILIWLIPLSFLVVIKSGIANKINNLLLISTYVKDNPPLFGGDRKLNIIIYTVTILVYLLSNLIFLYNKKFTTDSSEQYSYVIANKGYNTDKYGDAHYFIEIKKPDFVDFPFNFVKTEKIPVKKDLYLRIIPKQSIIFLDVNKGWFGFYYYSKKFDFNKLSDVAIEEPKSLVINQNITPEIKDACLWTKNFSLSAEIPNIPPQNYHHDFWDGGQPRSVEPLVNGQRHGLAHYTFANGTVYADIPWKNGQKHGVFTLYREDGSKDQTLSYKNGAPYGVNQWYSKKGKIIKSLLYLNNNKTVPAKTCDNL